MINSIKIGLTCASALALGVLLFLLVRSRSAPRPASSPDLVLERGFSVLAGMVESGKTARQAAVARTVPALVEEVKLLGRLEQSSDPVTARRRERMQTIATLLATNLVPVVPELRHAFLSGQAPGDAAWVLLQAGEAVAPILVEGLSSTNPRVQATAVLYVPRLDLASRSNAVPHLLKCVTNGTTLVKCLTAEMLGTMPDYGDRISLVLGAVLRTDTNDLVRISAAKALVNFTNKPPQLQQILLDAALNDPSSHVRQAARRASN